MGDETQRKSDHDFLAETRTHTVESLARMLGLLNRAKHLTPDADEDVKDLLFDAARTSVHDYVRWVKLGTRGFDILLDSLHGPHGKPAHHGHKPPQVSVRLQVRNGESASAQFVVENRQTCAVEVLFTKPDLQNANHAHLADVTFRRVHHAGPGTEFVIEPKGSARFAIDLTVGSDDPVGHYRGDSAIVVRNTDTGQFTVAGRLVVDVQVLALPTVNVNVRVDPTSHEGRADFPITNPLSTRAVILFAVPLRWDALPTGVSPTVAFSGAGTSTGLEPKETGTFTVAIGSAGNAGAKYEGSGAVLANGQLVARLKLKVHAFKLRLNVIVDKTTQKGSAEFDVTNPLAHPAAIGFSAIQWGTLPTGTNPTATFTRVGPSTPLPIGQTGRFKVAIENGGQTHATYEGTSDVRGDNDLIAQVEVAVEVK